VAAADLAGDLPRNPGSDQGGGLYRLLVESVRDYAIFALDTTGHVLSWNPGAERFKGYKAHEIIGKHFSVFYPEEDKAKPAHELEVAAIEGRFEDEGWRLRKDGTRFWANVVITALRNERGQLVGYAKVTRDLTERKAAEDRERESVRRAAQSEEASRAKTGFLAAMSHELRTPLNAIAGYADLLLAGVSGTLGPQQREYLERIRRSQQHLLSIINDILNFMRVDAGHVQYDVAPLSLRAICATVVQMIEPQALNKQIRVTPWAGPDVVAYADRAKVEQIVLNLLSNAVKFTEHGGRIVVVCATRGEEALLQVTDTGIGIPAEQLEAIFQPFVQVGRSLTSHHEGTGLGLAISSDMAIAMRGTLSVESTVGEGSTFTLSLPGKPPAAGDAA
jgi:PAS domain S-box-containing protein